MGKDVFLSYFPALFGDTRFFIRQQWQAMAQRHTVLSQICTPNNWDQCLAQICTQYLDLCILSYTITNRSDSVMQTWDEWSCTNTNCCFWSTVRFHSLLNLRLFIQYDHIIILKVWSESVTVKHGGLQTTTTFKSLKKNHVWNVTGCWSSVFPVWGRGDSIAWISTVSTSWFRYTD